MEETPDATKIILRRQLDDKDIEVSFHSRAPEFQNHEGDEEPEEGEDQNDQGVNDFYVAISK